MINVAMCLFISLSVSQSAWVLFRVYLHPLSTVDSGTCVVSKRGQIWQDVGLFGNMKV